MTCRLNFKNTKNENPIKSNISFPIALNKVLSIAQNVALNISSKYCTLNHPKYRTSFFIVYEYYNFDCQYIIYIYLKLFKRLFLISLIK